ncbi:MULTISPECIES: hypothetical protein [Psychrobacter]|uniref:hypothetical protein n=1 Tax=Psychrobacter TaxID=497 RepID=UPI00146D8240|nr:MULTISPECIES: hypothetical protein [Psychrobacter]
MSEDISSNNPMKEFAFALGGVGLFLGIVLLIGISAFLRPAGEHIKAEEPAAAETTEAAAAPAPAAKADASSEAADPAAAEPKEEAGAGATEAATPETPADATVTPAPNDNGGDVVAAEAGTATAEGTVSQAAVQASEPAAEVANAESGKPDSVAK